MGDQDVASKNRTVPVLTREDVEARMSEAEGPGIKAFYSSVYGGFTDDYGLMTLPIDDHQVHRGHAIFDTCHLIGGYHWGLEAHLDRFMRSSVIARIDVARLPIFPGGKSAADLDSSLAADEAAAKVRSRIREILLELFAFSGCSDGMARYWMSGGTGDFHVTAYECTPSMHAMVVPMDWAKLMDEDGKGAMSVATTDVPMKPPPYCVVKSTNYLQNCHVQMAAKDKGADAGIFTYVNGDGETCVAEGPTVNCIFGTGSGKLVVPSFQYSLRGVTLLRLIELIKRELAAGSLKTLTGVEIREVRLAEVLRMAAPGDAADDGSAEEVLTECMIVSSGNMGTHVTRWDGKLLPDTEFPCAKEVGRVLRDDMRPGGGSEYMAKIL